MTESLFEKALKSSHLLISNVEPASIHIIFFSLFKSTRKYTKRKYRTVKAKKNVYIKYENLINNNCWEMEKGEKKKWIDIVITVWCNIIKKKKLAWKPIGMATIKKRTCWIWHCFLCNTFAWIFPFHWLICIRNNCNNNIWHLFNGFSFIRIK